MNERVLVTGATGFVGAVLCENLAAAGYRVRAALRTPRPLPASIGESVVVGDIGPHTDWTAALQDVDAVVHLAARVHVMRDATSNANLYMEANARGTATLGAAAVAMRVRRFVYLSSVKVNGEETTGRPYSSIDTPHPLDDYGRSKWQRRVGAEPARLAKRLRFSIVSTEPPTARACGGFLAPDEWRRHADPVAVGSGR